MSGGAFDYGYGYVNLLADQVADLKNRVTEDGIPLVPLDIAAGLDKAAQRLREAATLAKKIEWYASGDYDDDTMREILARAGLTEGAETVNPAPLNPT